MKLKLKHKKERGITLIALVITIIVLLILAGVSIATLTGDNGILTKAQTAKTETEKASEEEQRQLAMLNATMNTENYDYEAEDGKLKIPAGFAPTGIEGENSIKDGVVITDGDGNEFVWIPCTVTGEKDKIDYNAKKDEAWKNYQYWYNGGEWGDSQPTTIGNPSIETNKGFYVARYEAGIPSDAPFYPNESNGYKYYKNENGEPTKNTDQYTPVSKKGELAWNYISQTKAKEAAKKIVSNGSVQSYLIDSHAWDTICRVIQEYDSTKDITDSVKWGNYWKNSTTAYESLNCLYALHNYNGKWTFAPSGKYSKGLVNEAPKGVTGNENRIELSTGASEDFNAYNIYDLAGNMWEWTTENGNINGDNPSESIPDLQDNDIPEARNGIIRGSGFSRFDGDTSVVVSDGDHPTSGCYFDVGFRVVLYLQPSNK